MKKSVLRIECDPAEKKAWNEAAGEQKLSEWVRATLNAASCKSLTPEENRLFEAASSAQFAPCCEESGHETWRVSFVVKSTLDAWSMIERIWKTFGVTFKR